MSISPVAVRHGVLARGPAATLFRISLTPEGECGATRRGIRRAVSTLTGYWRLQSAVKVGTMSAGQWPGIGKNGASQLPGLTIPDVGKPCVNARSVDTRSD